MSDLKDILWEGNSYEDLMSFPQEVRHDLGYQLHLVQSGEMPHDWKVLSGLGKGITGVFRTAYVAKFADTVAVLHCWQKKTQKTSESDKALIVQRYKAAQEFLND
jgi:phage-related protein